MRIAFVTIGDTRDIRRGSGTPYHLWKELERQGVTVHLVGPLDVQPPLPTRLFKWLSMRIGKKYFSYRDPFMANSLGRAAASSLRKLDHDILLTNDYSLAGYIRTLKPVILYTDDIFLRDYSKDVHPWNANLSWFGTYFCQVTTAAGLFHAAQCIFASHYAMGEAQKYNLPRYQDYSVIPYGANIDPPGNEKINTKMPLSQKRTLNLLFIGKDWDLKGGEIAVRVVELLRNRGVNTILHVVGVNLSDRIMHPFIKFYGFLRQDNEFEKKLLMNLYLTSDILIVPSKAEGYGLVFVEAAAYGVPSLAYRTTGVMTSVREGVSGVLFPLDADVTAFVTQIETWVKVPQEYARISRSAREYYEQTANWEVAVKTLLTLIRAKGFAA